MNNRTGGPRKGITGEQRAKETEEMLRLRRSGVSYEAIARQYGLTRPTVHARIKAAIQDIPKDEAGELRHLEALRLDFLEKQLQDGIQKKDLKAIREAVRINESRRRLLGLDMPQQHEVRVSREEQALAEQLAKELVERDHRESGENEHRG